MNDKTSLSIDELKNVLASLKSQKDSISKTHEMVNTVLESSSSCLSVSGLNYTTISDSFNNTFNDLDKNFDALIDVLENDVIKNYLELITIIRQIFNQEFAEKISQLLGI